MKNELNIPILQVFLDKRWQFKRVIKMQLEKKIKRGKRRKKQNSMANCCKISYVSSDTQAHVKDIAYTIIIF